MASTASLTLPSPRAASSAAPSAWGCMGCAQWLKFSSPTTSIPAMTRSSANWPACATERAGISSPPSPSAPPAAAAYAAGKPTRKARRASSPMSAASRWSCPPTPMTPRACSSAPLKTTIRSSSSSRSASTTALSTGTRKSRRSLGAPIPRAKFRRTTTPCPSAGRRPLGRAATSPSSATAPWCMWPRPPPPWPAWMPRSWMCAA